MNRFAVSALTAATGLMAVAAAAGAGRVSLSAADENAYFDLDRPYVAERQRLEIRPLDAAPDATADCAAARALVAADTTEIAALTANLEALRAKGRDIDPLLPAYLGTSEQKDRHVLQSAVDCAYDGQRPDAEALAASVSTALEALPPRPAQSAVEDRDLAALRAVQTRDVLLDDIVAHVEILEQIGAAADSARPLVGRLAALRSEQAAARRQRQTDLAAFAAGPETDALMARQVRRAEGADPAPIVGAWDWTPVKGQCREVHTYLPDGTMRSESGTEVLTKRYTARRVENGLWEVDSTVTSGNGGKDCTGSATAVGARSVVYLQMQNSGGYMTCATTDTMSCYGTATRAN